MMVHLVKQAHLECGMAVARGLDRVDLLEDVDHADDAEGRVLGVGLDYQAERSLLQRMTHGIRRAA